MHLIRCLALALLTLLTCAAPVRAEDLVIPGSGNPEYVLEQLATAFNRQQTRHRINVPKSTGTAGALRDVEAGTTSLGRVGRPLKDDERARGLSYVALGRDPVIFAAGAAVTLRNITPAQVLDIYTGKTTDWRELGGKPGPIRAIGREITDASRQAISHHIKRFETIEYGADVKVVHLDPQLIDRYPTSLGFLNRSALFASKTRIVALALDGVEGSPENLEHGRYPAWVEFGLIYKPGTLTPAARSFLEFVQSPAGARLLHEHGVLPTAPGR